MNDNRRRRTGAPASPLSAEDLLEMADGIEEHARDLLAQARKLQRMAERLSGGGPRTSRGPSGARKPSAGRSREPSGGRGPTGESGRSGERTRGQRGTGEGSHSGERGSTGPRTGRGARDEKAPSWAPPPRKRRS